jgi:ubiquinone/menaquinone biosynthesis C-methylase UbiE
MNWLAARIYDPFMEGIEKACLRQWREKLLASARGRVLEVGAGTGANLPYYGEAASEVILTEPDDHLRAQLRAKLPDEERFRLSPESIETLTAEPESIDTVVLTLVLCSVRYPDAALARLYRVLKPGGRLLFLEHVAAEQPRLYRVQRLVEPLWKICAGNCHLTRRSEEAIRSAGFTLEVIHREPMRKVVPFLGPSIRGIAQRPENSSESTF